MLTKIAFIAHPTKDIARSKKFFGEVLGLKLTGDYGDMWAEFETPDGQTLALDTYSPKIVDSPSPYMALETDDIEAEVARLREGGATVARDTWANKDGEGNELCRMALLLDPDGNPLMLHQMAEHRKS